MTLKIFLKLPGSTPSASACILSDKQRGIMWSTYWLGFLIAELSWIYQPQTMNNRVFNNCIRVLKDVHFPWTNCCIWKRFSSQVFKLLSNSQLTTGIDHQSCVESVKTNSLAAIPTWTWPKPACVAAISHEQYSFLLDKRFLLEKWGRIK